MDDTKELDKTINLIHHLLGIVEDTPTNVRLNISNVIIEKPHMTNSIFQEETYEFLMKNYYDYMEHNSGRICVDSLSAAGRDNLFQYLLIDNKDPLENSESDLYDILRSQYKSLVAMYEEILKCYNSCIDVGKLIITYVGYYVHFNTDKQRHDAAIITLQLKNYELLLAHTINVHNMHSLCRRGYVAKSDCVCSTCTRIKQCKWQYPSKKCSCGDYNISMYFGDILDQKWLSNNGKEILGKPFVVRERNNCYALKHIKWIRKNE